MCNDLTKAMKALEGKKAMELISTGSINGAVEAVGIRHRVLQAGGAHGSKDGDEARVPDEGGADDGKEPDDDDDDESFEVEEIPAEKHHRYLQPTIEGLVHRDSTAHFFCQWFWHCFGLRDTIPFFFGMDGRLCSEARSCEL